MSHAQLPISGDGRAYLTEVLGLVVAGTLILPPQLFPAEVALSVKWVVAILSNTDRRQRPGRARLLARALSRFIDRQPAVADHCSCSRIQGASGRAGAGTLRSRGAAMKRVHAALLALAIASTNPACAEID